MTSQFLITYDLEAEVLLLNNQPINKYEHKTCSGDFLIFRVTSNGLELEVPFFLLDNIFYYQLNHLLYFGKHLTDFSKLTFPDLEANKLLNNQEFLPHARTQLVGVNILCSYLQYTFSKRGLTIEPCYPSSELQDARTVEDLMDCFRVVFRKQVEKVNSEHFILPLSGGMDSRLLLDLALDIKGVELRLFTLGTERSGDVKVARRIATSLGLEKNHTVFNLEDINKNDLLDNYRACDYLLPLDRLLNTPLGNYFQKSAVLSGLYGDVIFADNTVGSQSYESYIAGEGIVAHSDDDRQIINAYNKLPKLPKLQRTLLRCQKLTRQSFPLSPGFEFITPFVDPEVITVASSVKDSGLYSSLVAKYMRPALKEIIHQSTMSYFTHPHWLRVVERKIFKLFKHPARLPYFDVRYLDSIDVKPNEAPLINN